ncbi:DUF4440 domain-containing protein [Rhizobium sp. AC44/96]|uniref:nuclear transport factor 2 family protein n=1 Tax=Rhizobium sp. AC44/96 TaxID=1841654 RepID=UPI00080FE57F|nr:nuclear transport factor 2 family protein [Rhizobium sp. AC44/96]OCJ13932.1 DUF4440 domain-containing protein [Rhizobium sp. AC44/96]
MTDQPEDLRLHLQSLEEKLFDPAVRSSRTSLDTLLAPDFREIGSSGRLYGFDEIIAALLAEPVDGTTRALADFEIRPLSPELVLATYRSKRSEPHLPPVKSLRSSIWRRDADGYWRMVFHQGTPAR